MFNLQIWECQELFRLEIIVSLSTLHEQMYVLLPMP
jgi:hypothetical protein